MNYFVLILAILSIILVILSKIYNLSIIFPTLVIILTIIVDVIVNTININKAKKENTNLDQVKMNIKK